MKLDTAARFEIKAEAFRIMTGHVAPGKSTSPETYPAPLDERYDKYVKWNDANHECVQAMILAFERIVPDSDETR